jgi:hypothetical protein
MSPSNQALQATSLASLRSARAAPERRRWASRGRGKRRDFPAPPHGAIDMHAIKG